MFLKGKPKKGNFSYFEYWFLGCENRVFVSGSLFGWGVFWVVCVCVCDRICFGYITVFLLGCFGWFPARFIFVFVNQNFVVVLSDFFFLFPPSYFARLILVLFCCVVYGVLCMFCVRFCVFFKSYVVNPCAALHVLYLLHECIESQNHAKM